MARDEIFCPITMVMPNAADEKAPVIVNDSIFGLSGEMFSENRNRGCEFARCLRAGRSPFSGTYTNLETPI